MTTREKEAARKSTCGLNLSGPVSAQDPLASGSSGLTWKGLCWVFGLSLSECRGRAAEFRMIKGDRCLTVVSQGHCCSKSILVSKDLQRVLSAVHMLPRRTVPYLNGHLASHSFIPLIHLFVVLLGEKY